MTEDDSPFDDLDADEYRDREGDPFDHLDSAPGGEQTDDSDSADSDSGEFTDTTDTEDVSTGVHHETGHSESERTEPDPFEYLGTPGARDSSSESEEETAGDRGGPGDDEVSGAPPDVEIAGDPLGDVDVSRGDPFESTNNPFERVDVEGVDPDEVWERFTADAESSTVEAGESAAGDESTVTDRVDEADVVDVEKHRFCETCPHFSAPPAVDCGHPGTDILEFVGTDEIRVSNCPVVRERRELGEVHE